MRLTRAHQAVEGDHRRDAWEAVLGQVESRDGADAVVEAVADAHRGWLAYRDGVARAMGLSRGDVVP
jgi:pyrroloquinoline-quinone synthase